MCCWSVGLVQGEIEAAGFATISLSMIPDLTASTPAPRIAAVERPFGLTFGLPGDAAGQRDILRAALHGLASISDPGGVVHLPFGWSDDTKVKTEPPQIPPVAKYIIRRPWAFTKFYTRTPPDPAASAGG